MSYSFQIRAKTKNDAIEAIAKKLDEIAAAQHCHERDKQEAIVTARMFVNLLPDNEAKEVAVTMSGSLAGQWQGSDVTLISSANINATAALVDPLPA